MINKKKYLIIGIFFLLTISLLGTFAWYTFGTKKSSLSLVLGADEALLVTLSPFELDALADPVTSYSGMTDYVNIMASNTKSAQVKFQLFYDIEDIDLELSSSSLKYAVTRSTTENGTYTEISTGTFSNTEPGDHKIIYEETISAYTIYYYRIYTYIDGNQPNSSELQGKTLKATMGAEMTETIYEYISKNADTTTQIDFSKTSEQDNTAGIYKYNGTNPEGAYPIYFYRGAVTNNNVYFGGFCWKIVRTTGTGGVKLIYNGLNTGTNESPACNETGVNNTLSTTTTKFNSAYLSINRSLAYAGYMYGEAYQQKYLSDTGTGWYYAPDVTYSNGEYSLVSKEINNVTYNVEIKNDITETNLNYHHYTCGSSTATTCEQVKYVFFVSSPTLYYIDLSTGTKIEDVIHQMLSNSSNSHDSSIKTIIDNWYSSNMISYTNKIEDTPYCNDRSIYSLGGFDPDGGDQSSYLIYSSYSRKEGTVSPTINCEKNDAFTVSDTIRGNGALTYPVALITADESQMAGGKYRNYASSCYLISDNFYWTMTPFYSTTANPHMWTINNTYWNNSIVGLEYSIRPVISLKHNNTISSGTGTNSNPFIVE